jgi:MinD-like ATPase involved in chromosome partitioning or flagellar assembly
MTGRPTVILALTPIAEREVEPLLFDTADPPLTLLSSAVEADELQRAVEQETPDAVLLSPELSGLTAGHCVRVRATGARLVGLALDGRERNALAALSVDETIDSTVSRDDLLAAVRGGAGETRPTTATPAPPRLKRGDDAGSVLAVVGAQGAPGASECAASLAALAAAHWPTLLVEIDALGGGLDVRLGADSTQGSLLGLIRAADGGGVQRELVERWLTEPDGWPPVLLGSPDPQALSELAQPGAMTRALHELSSLYALTVCDVGAFLGDDGALSAAARLHREALIAADAVLLVLGARDIQLRHGLHQLDLLLATLGIPSERLRIIGNAIGAPGTASRSAITQTITAHLAERGVTVDAWLPWDARALTQAGRRGTPLATARKRSGYTRSLSGLLNELFLPATPTPKGRKRRLAAPHQQPHEEQVVWQR